jgi:hypothetical protein
MNKYIYIGIGVILLILISLYIGKSIGEKDQRDSQNKDRIKVVQVDSRETIKKIDSLGKLISNIKVSNQVIKGKEIIIREKAKDIVLEKPKDTEVCDELYDAATEKISLLEETITVKDTIEKNLNSIINTQESIILNKDRIIANKDEEIKLTKELGKTRNKKFSIGIQLGYGATVTTHNNTATFKTAPYIGIGVSRTLFSF